MRLRNRPPINNDQIFFMFLVLYRDNEICRPRAIAGPRESGARSLQPPQFLLAVTADSWLATATRRGETPAERCVAREVAGRGDNSSASYLLQVHKNCRVSKRLAVPAETRAIYSPVSIIRSSKAGRVSADAFTVRMIETLVR